MPVMTWDQYPWEQHIAAYRAKAPEIMSGGCDRHWTPDLKAAPDIRSDVTDVVSLLSEIPRPLLTGKGKAHAVCRVRHVAWLILYDHYGMNYSQIGRYFGRPVDSIKSGIKRCRSRVKTDVEIEWLWQEARKKLELE